MKEKITLTKTDGKNKLSNDTDWVSALNGIEISGKCFKLSLEFKFNGDSKELFPNNYKETKDGFELLYNENKTLLVIKILGESGQNKYLLQAVLKKYLEFRDEETTTTNYFIDTDRTIRLVKGTSQSTIVYYRQIEGTEYERLLQLTINEDGYVNFPASGNHFNRYGGIDEGGRCPYTNEDVGFGDHFLTPDAAAALLGVISEIGDEGWEVHLGDMSSENGSDPWDINNVTTRNIANKTYGHHAGHGHFGTQSGVNIDFRYLATNGVSFQGRWDTDSRFDDDKNRAFFEIANAYGFGRNYATGKDYAGVNPSVRSHYDHGHLGGNHINIITTEKFKFTVK